MHFNLAFYMIETSKDLLNIVLSISIVWITVFLCWALYYIIRTLHDLRSVSKNLRHTSTIFIDFLDELKDKLIIAATSTKAISTAVEQLVCHVTQVFGTKKTQRRQKTKDK